MTLSALKQHETFREKLEKYRVTVFYRETTKAMRKVLNNNKYHVLSLLMLYKQIKTTFFKVLGSVIYCFIDKLKFLDYLWMISNFMIPPFMIYMALGFLRFYWKSCIVMYSQENRKQISSWLAISSSYRIDSQNVLWF